MLRLNVLLPLLAALLFGLAPQPPADDYPTKPITLDRAVSRPAAAST
jgi:hypothetical protein